MRHRTIRTWITVAALALVAVTVSASASSARAAMAAAPAQDAARGPIAARVESVLRESGFESGHWGLLVVDSASGKVVYEKNADRLFCPASVTKLFSCAAALLDLGPDYRFATLVHRRGEVDANGRLQGDLILRASGDLALGGRSGPNNTLLFKDDDHSYAPINRRSAAVAADPLAGLAHLARQVKESGTKEITGDVLVDDRLFEAAGSTGTGPAKVSPIVINDHVVAVLIVPASKAGLPAVVTLVPASSVHLIVDAQVQTVKEGEKAKIEVAKIGDRRYRVQGRVPAGSEPLPQTIEIEDPASFARSLFIEELRKQGVATAASPLGENDSAKLPQPEESDKLVKVAELNSPPFREYLKVILKVSQNLHASSLPMLIAAHHGERTLTQGMKRQAEILKTLGVSPRDVSFGGGAGGSRSDLVTPRATVALLKAIAARPEIASLFQAALPVLGRDGTLARIGVDSKAKGHAFAKTGTFYVVNELNQEAVLVSKALAGYLETASGRNLIFAFFVNHVPIPDQESEGPLSTIGAGKVLGRLCEVFHVYEGTPE